MFLASRRLLASLSLVVVVVGLALLAARPAAAQTSLTAYEQEVVNLVNQQRAANGLAPLSVDARLVQAARNHNAAMLSSGQFAHQVSGEAPVCAVGANNDRYDAVGYPWVACGENIAAGQTTPQAVVNAWMGSSGHRANILNPSYKHIGVGYATGGAYGTLWTQDFGASSGGGQPVSTLTATPVRTATPVATATPIRTATPAATPVRTATPAPSAPGVDKVQVTRATYTRSTRYLMVDATSSNPSATLRLYSAAGQYLGVFRNLGSGRYSITYYTYYPPSQVSVRSSAGGVATATVTMQ